MKEIENSKDMPKRNTCERKSRISNPCEAVHEKGLNSKKDENCYHIDETRAKRLCFLPSFLLAFFLRISLSISLFLFFFPLFFLFLFFFLELVRPNFSSFFFSFFFFPSFEVLSLLLLSPPSDLFLLLFSFDHAIFRQAQRADLSLNGQQLEEI